MEKGIVVSVLDMTTNIGGNLKNFAEFDVKIYRNCHCEYRNLH